MPLFQYKAFDINGKKVQGIIDATHIQEAKRKLLQQDIFLNKISDISYKKNNLRISKKTILNFTKELSRLLDAQIPLFEALLALEEKYQNQKIHPLILDLLDQLKNGKNFSEALKKHKDIFSPLYCSLIEHAENTGNLSKSLNELELLLSEQEKLKKQIVSSLLYPCMLAGFCFLVLVSLIFFILPSFAELFEGRDLNGFTSIIIKTSLWAHHYKMLFFSFFLFFLFLIVISQVISSVKKWLLYEVGYRMPYFSKIIKKIAFVRFARACGGLLENGVTLMKAMSLSRQSMSFPKLEKLIAHAEERITEGSSLSVEFTKAGFPSLFCRLIAIAEKTGNLSFMFYQIANIYEEEVNKSLTQLTVVAQPFLLLFLGVIVGIIVLSVLLPLTDVSSLVNF